MHGALAAAAVAVADELHVTCAMPDILLKHPDKIFATYV